MTAKLQTRPVIVRQETPASLGEFLGRAVWAAVWILVRLVVGMKILPSHDETTHRPRATWLRSRRAVAERPSLNPLDRYPGYYRQLWRLGVAAVVTGWFLATTWTIAVVVASAVAVGAWWVHRRQWSTHVNEVVAPLWGALAPMLKLSTDTPWRDYLAIPRNYREQDVGVVLVLPETWHGSTNEQAAIVNLIQARLGGAWNARWHTSVFPPRAEFTRPKPPPNKVLFSEIDDHGPEHLVPIGKKAGGKVLHVDVRGETPHGLVTAPTRWGKTSLLLLLVAWFRRCGALVTICDPKRMGFIKAFGRTPEHPPVPGITIHTDLLAQMDAINAFRESMDSYYRAAENHEDITDAKKYPTRILVIDEMSSFVEEVKIWWRNHGGPEGKGGKGVPDVLVDYMYILWQGGFARHHLIVGSHTVDLNTIQRTNLRDQFGWKVFMGPQGESAWRMAFGYVKRIRIPMVKGRAIVGIGTDLDVAQIAYIDDLEARALAMEGVSVPAGGGATLQGETDDDVQDAVPDGDTGAPIEESCDENDQKIPGNPQDASSDGNVPPVPGPDLVIGIAAAARLLGMNEEAFRKARHRVEIDGEMRVGQQPAWTQEILLSWHSKRRIAGNRTVTVPPQRGGEFAGKS